MGPCAVGFTVTSILDAEPILLFQPAAEIARQRQCRWLDIETQNVNVGACRFYARQGCELRGIHPRTYVEFPDEVQLLLYYDL
jgi:hypothetical protein